MGQRVVRDFRIKIYHKLLDLSLDFFAKKQAGKLISQITYDTGIIQGALVETLFDLVLQSFQLMVYLVTVLYVRWYYSIPWSLVVMSLILLPLVGYLVARVGAKVRKISAKSQEKMGQISSRLYETISGARILKAFSMEEREKERFDYQTLQFYKLMMKSARRTEAVGPFTELVGMVCAIGVLWVGGKEVVQGRLDSGAFLYFLAALLSLIKPFKRLSRVHLVNQQAGAALKRAFDIMDEQPTVGEKKDAVPLPRFQKEIVFEHVSFDYGGNEILKNIDLTVRAGEFVAIVGPSGVGKSTMVNLMPRFYDPTHGVIRIDGIDIRDVTFKSLREQIGIVTQETILFNDTVLENLKVGSRHASQEDIERACKMAGCYEFIKRLEDGYETIIGDQGLRLSGGERQRLAIARALLKDPPILILDEATSQLDSTAEKVVQDALEKLMAGRTVFIIAHRLSTIKSASRIIVLNQGMIANIGTHETLIKEDPVYSKLYQVQSEPL
jgi:subfamily B ATP-binding cassette protein MsbA